MNEKLKSVIVRAAALLLLAGAAGAQAPYPPLTTEISAEHPLFLFRVAPPAGAANSAYAQFVIDAWNQLAENFRPYSALNVNVPGGAEGGVFLQALQDAGVPVVIRVSAGGRGGRQDLTQLEGVLSAFTTVRGIEPRGMRLDTYDGPDDSGDLTQANAAWLGSAIETAAKYGRFVHWPLQGLDAARFLAHPAYANTRARMLELAAYVAPSSVQRSEHITQGNAGCAGMWLAGMAGAWGVTCDPAWYTDARLISPGVLGKAKDVKGPASAYRGMALTGAMGGAWIYAFDVTDDLWLSSTGAAWNEVIAPVLGELIDLGLAPRKEFLLKAVPMAFQLAEAGDPRAFHRNLHDLSPTLDAGVLWRAAFGDLLGPVPALGGLPVLPLLPPGAAPGTLAQFTTVAQADETATLEQRQALVDAARTAAPAGAAFSAQVGRGIYVFNTDPSRQAPQPYTIAEAPAAVRGLEARRENDGVTLTWPFREGDVSYNVYKRVSPQLRFTSLARGVEERRFTDPLVPTADTVAYAVTALTNEKETLQGTVNFGEYLAFSVVESRIAEEALLTPVLSSATAQPYAGFSAPPLAGASPADGLPEAQKAIAQTLEERLGTLKAAFEAEDLGAVLGLYADEYEDPAGWRLQYVKRAYEAIFARCMATRLSFQVRRWDFSAFDTSGQVNAVVYCSLRGNAISDSAGRNADIRIELPRTETNEVLISWTGSSGAWRIQRTDPALPSLDDFLAYGAGPYDGPK